MTSSGVMSELNSTLNRAQREAVEHGEGPLLVIAGAGSGKTRVLTMRIANLIHEHGVNPAHILAVTFTNKAAREMLDRITRLTGQRPPGMWMGTFHSLGARFLRMHSEAVARTSGFTIYDADDAVSLIKRVVAAEGVRIGQLSPRAIMAAISEAKNNLVDCKQYASLANEPFTKVVAEVYTHLEAALRTSNAATFDDLLTLPVELFRNNADVLRIYQRRFRFILVDEYQDTNHAQFQLISLLGAHHGNVCVVGDDDQSIYGWRGADIRNILDFEKSFPGARIVRLEENYRSTPGILSAANAIISRNVERRGKTLRATLPAGEPVSLMATLDERDEAEWITDEISARRSRDMSLELRDIAIIYRTNAQSRILEEVFRRRSINYRLIGSVGFFERREVKDLVSYLRLIANPADNAAFVRAISVPRRGIGDTTLEQLAVMARGANVPLLAASAMPEITSSLRPAVRVTLNAFADLMSELSKAATTESVSELLQRVDDAIGYADYLKKEEVDATERLENMRELVSSADATVVTDSENAAVTQLDAFLQQVSLIAEVDALDPNADAVTLMTVHNAKGLEFPVVFISGLEDGLFPLARAYDDPPLLEEECRLLYVGITRAERKLYLSWAASRRRNGELRESIISSFLRDALPGLWEEKSTVRLRSTARASNSESYVASRRATYGVPSRPVRQDEEDVSQDTVMFTMGTRVRHGKFGSGTISDVTGAGRDAKVTVDFDDESIGRKRLVVAYAGLESGWDE